MEKNQLLINNIQSMYYLDNTTSVRKSKRFKNFEKFNHSQRLHITKHFGYIDGDDIYGNLNSGMQPTLLSGF